MMPSYEIHNECAITGMAKLEDRSVDLVVADPPYGLFKDYGNRSDHKNTDEIVAWLEKWVSIAAQKLKKSGTLYIFASWRNSPELFSMVKKKMIMVNEIIWDRRVPSQGGSTRRFSSVHDNIGMFVHCTKNYYFDIDAVRIPYDPETKKARTRSIFVGAKWLEMGCNPKDVWSVSRLHAQHREREAHPTQKPLEIIDRMIRASSPEGGLVVDPFSGSGTTLISSINNGRRCVSYEINPNYVDIIYARVNKVSGLLVRQEPKSATG